MQGGVPGVGDFTFANDTAHSIELNVTAAVAEWGGLDVRFPIEQDAVLAKDGVRFLDGRQTRLHLIR
jgi:hypothetical protein